MDARLLGDDNTRGSRTGSVQGTELRPSLARDEPVAFAEPDLPFLPVTLTFDNVRYHVPVEGASGGGPLARLRGGGARPHSYASLPLDGDVTDAQGNPMKQLLFGVSGVVKPGTVLAIMGPSGSGKTTLIDIMAGRKTQGVVSGDILFNREPKSDFPRLFRRITAYAPQEDVLMETLTVGETLGFAAELRLPDTMSAAGKAARVRAVVDELNLGHILDSTVGGLLLRGISGGEKKRLAIAVELITSPSLLFLDELTTGLSATDALHVMSTINRIAKSGRTIVATIHQPRSSAFALIDRLLLLSRGRQMYFGQARDAAPYFSELGYPLPEGFNVADHVLDVITEEQGGSAAQAGVKVGNSVGELAAIARAYQQSRQAQIVAEELCESASAASKTITQYAAQVPELQRNYGASFGLQFRTLVRRNSKNIARNRFLFRAQLVQNIFFALIVGSLWSSLNQNPAQGELFALFFVPVFLGLVTFAAAPSFIQGRVLFNRERASGSYLTMSYLLSNIVTELPTYTFTSVVFVSISYWMIGLNASAGCFLFFMVACVLHTNVAVSLVGLFGAAAPTIELAMAFAQLTNTFSLLFAGFFVTYPNIPDAYRPFYYLSYHQWVVSGLTFNQFGGTASETEIYDQMGLPAWGHESKWTCLCVQLVMLLVFRTMTFFVLRYGKSARI